MKRIKHLLAALALLAAASPLAAQCSLYWDLPATPGSLSLGLASLALSPEPEGLSLNPARLSEISWRTVRASGLQWWQDVYAGTFSGVVPAKPLGTASLSFGYWSFGSLVALSPQGEPLGSIEPKSILWGLGLGRKLLMEISAGLAVKGYSLIMPDRKDWGWALDAGASYRHRFLTGSLLARNLGTRYPVNSDFKFDLPASVNLGLSARAWGERAEAGLVFTSARDQKPVVSAGLELRPLPFASLRLGYDNDEGKPERSPLGLGIAVHTTGVQDYSVEYGYRSYGGLGDVHAFSIGMNF
jgi:hypothetical protein